MLNSVFLQKVIKAKLIEKGFRSHNIAGVPSLDDFIAIFCDSILDHIKTAGVVSTVVQGTCSTGPITGTGTGTLS